MSTLTEERINDILDEMTSYLPRDNVLKRIERMYAIHGKHLIATTSGGEVSAFLPHLMKKALGNEAKNIRTFFNDTLHYKQPTLDMIRYIQDEGFDVTISKPVEKIYPPEDENSPEYGIWLRAVKHMPLENALESYKTRNNLDYLIWMDGLMDHREKEMFYYRDGFRFHPPLNWTTKMVRIILEALKLPINDQHYDITKGKNQKNECKIRVGVKF